jgi:dTDP-4-amino-4,6-dideoxy-D-galactose acyltransferase
MFADGDRTLHAESLTRVLDARDDFRFIARSGGEEVALFGERLPWDSDFFGYEVARLHGVFPLTAPLFRPHADFSPAVASFVRTARDRGIRYLLALVDARDLATIRAVGESGFSLIETRPVYQLCVRDYAYPQRFACRFAVPDDMESLARTARDSVNPYDRFHSDPFLDPEVAGRMLYRMTEASLRGSFADRTVVPDVPRPTAFTSVRYLRDRWPRWRLNIAQFALAACALESKGWATKVFSEMGYHLKEMGVDYVTCATQLPNRAMVRICEKLGYSLGKVELMFRIVL